MIFKRAAFLAVFCLAIIFAAPRAFSQMDTGSVYNYAPNSASIGTGDRYVIILKDCELREALRFLAKVSGLNIMIPESVTGVVNARFDDVRVIDAINSIVRANDLDYAVERDVLRVGKTGQFATTGEDLKTETFRLKFATAKDLVENVKALLTDRGSVLADERTNSLVVRERTANIDSVKRFLDDIDLRDTQIHIESKILEATRDFSRNLGIQWGVNSSGNKVNVVGVNAVGSSDSDRYLNVNLPAANPTSGLGLIIGTLVGNMNIDMQITAAEKRGNARIISEPSIVTSNGVSARIRSGETLLIKTTGDLNIGSATTPGDTGLHEIETGVELNVTPQISGDRLVKLKIDAQTSQPDFTREVEGIPVIVDNTAATEVLVLDGQTTVIGGLFKFLGSDTVKEVPFFSHIPIMGNLFRSRAKSKTNTELMIFIKPTIVRPADELLEYNAKAEQVEDAKSTTIVAPMEAKRGRNKSDTREDHQLRFNNPHLKYRQAR